MTARPATLTPSTAGVRWCHGTRAARCRGFASRSRRVTASDSNRGFPADGGSAKLGTHVFGEERDVVQIRHIEKLQVDPLYAGLDEGAQLVDDFGGSPYHR